MFLFNEEYGSVYSLTAYYNHYVEYFAYQFEMALSLSLPTCISALSRRLMSILATCYNTVKLYS